MIQYDPNELTDDSQPPNEPLDGVGVRPWSGPTGSPPVGGAASPQRDG